MRKNKIVSTKKYAQILTELKKKVQEAQIKAILAVNEKLIRLYWSIGKIIAERQQENGWGSGIIEKLAKDLQNEFPGMSGFSRANIFYMRSFYLAYEKVQQPVGQLKDMPIFTIPWGHNVILITRLKNNDQRLWYAKKAIKNGWSRSMLETQIKSDLFRREGKAITNFNKTLTIPQSNMAQQTLKDPYMGLSIILCKL